ncbi:NfeD family protein [Noviherbaspirillum sp. UKPF54]|uniref:NfeD family protein n=1 Tax=Noviherbaspirillum sp. UKPF54 TaxID=2601898 RepID=UPI00352B8E33
MRGLKMADWMIWFVFAGALVILEMFTGTFYLLMIGFGLVAGGLVAFAGLGREAQLIGAGIVGAIATYGLRRSKWGGMTRRLAARDPNVNLDIGQALKVDAWNEDGKTARVTYRGALWDVELEHDADCVPGIFTIREIRGNRLIVSKDRKQDN